MAIRLKYLLRLIFLFLLFVSLQTACSFLTGASAGERPVRHDVLKEIIPLHPADSVLVRMGTFLGNDKRNYYGDSAGNRLDVVWKMNLGGGTTIVNDKKGIEEWFGAGWTGQPLVVKEKEKTYLIQGAFDHHLKKIDAATGALVWEYAYDDIIKGTGTIWKNDSAADPQNRLVVLQGSRKGVKNLLGAPRAESYRAVSYFTGKELWRMNVEHTRSYSRDVDASALIFEDTAYIGLENGKFISFDPGRSVLADDTVNYPHIYTEEMLYSDADAAHHGGNLVTESSPARIGDHIYITAGSGHVYGFDLKTKMIDWDFYIGSDMDGSPVVTSDSCLLVEVEKQYIAGNGGIFKLNPRKNADECVEWYYPTGDFNFSSWEGGVIGSASVNDAYNADGMYPHMAAFTGIDGWLTVVRYDRTRSDTIVTGPDGKTKYKTPELLFRKRTGPSISTPLFVQDKLIAAGYGGISLFQYDRAAFFTQLAFHSGIFETTPVADAGRIYAASRDGYLYCFGDTSSGKTVLPAIVSHPVIAKEEIKPKKKEVKTPVSSVVATTHPQQERFYLVAGAFRVKSNADASIAQWKKRGLDAAVLLSPGGLYYITLANSLSQDEIDAKHESLKKDYAVDAWVYQQK